MIRNSSWIFLNKELIVKQLGKFKVDSSILNVTGKSWRAWILGVDMFHFYMTKNLLISLPPICMSYIGTLCSSHHLCTSQIKSNSSSEHKFLKLCSLWIEANAASCVVLYFWGYWGGSSLYGRFLQKWRIIRANLKDTREIEGISGGSPHLSATGSLGGFLWVLGTDMFHLHITKNLLILFATYMQLSHLGALCSSHHLCPPQIEENPRMELKSFSKFGSLGIGAEGVLTLVLLSLAWN